LAELLALEPRARRAHHWGITHFKESGDVYPHDADGWSWILAVLVAWVINEIRDDWWA